MMRFRSLLLIFPVLAAVFLSGCGAYTNLKKSTENIVRDFRAPDDDLKKSVFRVALYNQVAASRQDLGEAIASRYGESLPQSCPVLLLIGPDNQPAYQPLNQLFQNASGPMDNLALVRIGKQLGLTAVVSSRFYAIAIRKEDTGILWLRKKLPFAWISASTEVFDIETGAKFMDQTFTREIELDEDSAEQVKKGNVASVPKIDKAVNEIIKEMADAVCDALIRKPWKGFVTRVSGDGLTLSSGSDAGLAVGRVLKVYGPGSRIQGTEGQTYLLPGNNIGEIRITAVRSDSADAEIVSGGGFQVDDVVKTK
jgi:hypothetical protein